MSDDSEELKKRGYAEIEIDCVESSLEYQSYAYEWYTQDHGQQLREVLSDVHRFARAMPCMGHGCSDVGLKQTC